MTSGPEWFDPIGDEERERLAGPVFAALLTTYDPPDATVFVEDLLPRWFSLDREPSSDETSQRYFHAELAEALGQRRGALTVFCTNASLGADSQHWLWGHFVRYFVRDVQHAKLWLLLRRNDQGQESLDLRVSSTNLTGPALRGQVQAGYRCIVPLVAKETLARQRSWGPLPAFLSKLANRSADGANEAVARWQAILGRCEAPDGVTFIASVPGEHRGVSWGAPALGAALRLPAHGEVDVFVPTVGQWTVAQLKWWAASVGTRPQRLRLVWVPRGHPWAKHWTLPTNAVPELATAGASILTLEDDDRRRLHTRYRDADERWPHAKVYWFQRGAAPRVLITSANWSAAAWGRPTARGSSYYVKNFELGVLVATAKRPFSSLPEMADGDAATVELESEERVDALWGHAVFDGTTLVVQLAPVTSGPANVRVLDAGRDEHTFKTKWQTRNGVLETTVRRRWPRPPTTVVVTVQEQEHWLAVEDRRPDLAGSDDASPPPGFGEGDLERMRAALLEERYGGRLLEDSERLLDPHADPAAAPEAGGAAGAVGDGVADPRRTAADYSVWVLEEARRVLGVVDNWAGQSQKTAATALSGAIERDGRELLRAWRKEAETESRRRVALRVACDELAVHLQGLS
ncbi:MAG: hypothetical protein Q8O67_31835 [Deltaproteobacteria bacterium]|nr:hypothetical protein [Deltaproteobacteria bacterium]